jgi:hypothetical protein
MQIGNNYMCLLGCLSSIQSFYFEILHQYYTGAMILGPGNGVSDGSIIMYGIYIYAGIRGNGDFMKIVEFTSGETTY